MSKEFDDFMDGVKNIDLNKIVCMFEPRTDTSSATICKHCGQEKFLHIQFPQHEISDEEIYKASREHITDGGGAQGWIEAAFRQGAVWYREQLRQKTK